MTILNFERVIETLADDIFETASSKGFWEYENLDQLVLPLKLVLVISEVIEALEVHRKEYDDDDEDELTGFTPMQEDDFLEELADGVIRIFDIVGSLDASNHFGDIILSKMEKNRNRPYRHGKRY